MTRSNPIDRRCFLRLAAAASTVTAAPSLFAQQAQPLTFSFSHQPAATVPLDFLGLSYESPQLANPSFFSPANTGLVKLYRDLTPHGVLRTGGNLSAFTMWRDDPAVPITPTEQAAMDRGKKYWEWDLTDPSIQLGPHEAVFTPASIRTLAAFLETTGWKLIYGLNFATGTPEQAAAEVACVQQLVGKNLIAFQLGNELDFWKGGFRSKDWDFDHFYAQWAEWVRIIRQRTPNAPFAGPDTGVSLEWMEKLAARQKGDLALLSKHHYAMGPAGAPGVDAERLLEPDADVAKEIAAAKRAKTIAGVGFRNTECNSCYHGGQTGASDAYASALWGADYILSLMQGGHLGVNLHGGGNGIYSPIVGDAKSGITPRPLYYGMQFAQHFAGATILQGSLTAAGVNATAYAATAAGKTLVALINKTLAPVEFRIAASSLGGRKLFKTWQLFAPRLESKTLVTLAPVDTRTRRTPEGDTVTVPPYAAMQLHYS